MTYLRLLPFGLLVFTVGCNEDRLRRLEKENQELAAKLNTAKTTASLELQKKCADQAAAQFKEWGWNKKPAAFYTNHYHQTMNKCFVQIEDTAVVRSDAVNSVSVSDAFEGEGYAEFVSSVPEGKLTVSRF